MLPPRKRPRSFPRGLVALLALLAACRGASSGREPVARVEPSGGAGGAAVSDPAVEALIRALSAALEEGEDELAARILAGLRARTLGTRERELVASAERVLRGRELVRTLDLSLASEPGPGGAGYRLVLVARSRAAEELRLCLPPCDLKRLRSSMDARGFEGLEFESRTSAALAALRLAPGIEQRVELLAYELPLGRALGVRERWRVETRSGEIECQGTFFPAANVPVAGCERERLAALVEPEPAPPGALAERLGADPAPAVQELLELALRTGQGEREAALRALAPVVRLLARSRPERVVLAEPALRWLTQNRDIGADAAGWARYLEARVTARAADSVTSDGLDLPVRAREEPREAGERQ